MPLSSTLLEIVRCPKCLGQIAEETTSVGHGLVCQACKLVYPIIDELPHFLIEEARPLK